MRHSVHIMFGKASEEALLNLKEYIAKFGHEAAEPYLNGYLYCEEKDKSISITKVIVPESEDAARKNYTAQLAEEQFTASAEQRSNHLLNFFRDLYSNTINISNPGDFVSLHICLHVPLYDRDTVRLAQEIATILSEGKVSVDIDIIGMYADMAQIFIDDETEKKNLDINSYITISKESIKDLVKYRKANPNVISHFLAIRDMQNRGPALNLSRDSYNRIIGEFALAALESYSELFGSHYYECDLQTLGLSMISLDRFYFVEYLLTHTYLHVMDKERIMQESVDVNMAVLRSTPLLEKWCNLMSEFYDKEIKPRLDNLGDGQQSVVVTEVTPILEELFTQMRDDLESYIKDPELSIPEKKAILSMLLGEDDPLLMNAIFDKSKLVIDDLDQEAMELYFSYNNLLLGTDYAAAAALSTDGEPAVSPFEQIRTLRTQIQESAGYIRNLQTENERLEEQVANQDVAEKLLIENGYFVYGGNKYKILPDDDQGEALKETYIPHEPANSSSDLRVGFPEVKNQGQQGSCLAFAVTSTLEFMLKSNNDPKPDLSESFLYYNARALADATDRDEGSRVDYSLTSLVELGICSEELCPYDENVYNIKPSEQAYEDAKARKVKKALNVTVNVRDIKSALEDGYPVGISANIYPSFVKNVNGLVTIPTQQEREAGKGAANGEFVHGRHAMVVCGFSEEYKFFIVRNSWGKGFGDSGYCYIPYAYFEGKGLINHAWVVTEVSDYTIKQLPGTTKFSLKLNRDIAAVSYTINLNLIAWELEKIAKLKSIYTALYQYYTLMKQKLKNPSVQERIISGSENRLRSEITIAEQQKRELESRRREALDIFDKRTIWLYIYYGLGVLLSLVAAYLLFRVDSDSMMKDLSVLLMKTFFVIACCTLLVALVYFPWRLGKRRSLKEEFDYQLRNKAIELDMLRKDLETVRLKLHIAGMILVNLFDINDKIRTKHSIFNSFVANLRRWYGEESARLRNMSSDTQPPFISILNNDILKSYYDANRDNITKDIRLWELMLGYELSEDGIRRFQKSLNKVIEDKIAAELASFSIYKYVAKEKVYPFLSDAEDMLTLLRDMDKKSNIFLRCDESGGALEPSKIIMINTTSEEQRKWADTYRQAFTVAPVSTNILSTYKIVIFQIQNLDLSQVDDI